MEDDIRHLSDFHLCHECMEGDADAIERLRERSAGPATAYLINAGAQPGEAAEIIERLWADLLAPPAEGLPRISHYNGRCAFQTWFNTVALNKLISRKRKQARWQKIMVDPIGGDDDERYRSRPPVDPAAGEPDGVLLVEMMREAIEHAFITCEPEDFVLLQLRHCDGLMGKELAVMFGCDPSVISRRLEKAQEHIAAATLWKLRQQDPWLELRWSDFVDLCRTATPACFGLD